MREVVNFATCTVPATAITLNPMNPSAFKITTGDASENRNFHSQTAESNIFVQYISNINLISNDPIYQ